MSDENNLDDMLQQLNPYDGPQTLKTDPIKIGDKDVIDLENEESVVISLDILEGNLVVSEENESKIVDIMALLNFYGKWVVQKECDRLHFDVIADLAKHNSGYSNPSIEFMVTKDHCDSNVKLFNDYVEGFLSSVQNVIMDVCGSMTSVLRELVKVLDSIDDEEIRTKHTHMKTYVSTVNQCYMSRKGEIFNSFKMEFKELKKRVYEDGYETPQFEALSELFDKLEYSNKTIEEIVGLIDITLETLYSVDRKTISNGIEIADKALDGTGTFDANSVYLLLRLREEMIPVIHDATRACHLFQEANVYDYLDEGCIKVL